MELARLQKREGWTRAGALGVPLARVLCGARNARGAQTCRGVFGLTSSAEAAYVLTVHPLIGLQQDPSTTGVAWPAADARWLAFMPGWREVDGTWTVSADAKRRAEVNGEAGPRRSGTLRRRVVAVFDVVTGGRTPDLSEAEAGRLYKRQVPALYASLPVRVLCLECGTLQMVTEDVLRAGGLFEPDIDNQLARLA